MKGVRLLNNGKWNKPPVLTAARRILVDSLSTHFQKCTLGEAAVFLNGTSYDIDQVSEFGNAPIIRISNITDPGSIYLRTNESLDHNFWVTAGDLLVSWSASFKSIIWPGPEGYLNQHIFKVTERVGFDRRFIRHAIEASFDEMQEDVVGIGMMHLRRSDFLGHQIPKPPTTIQRAIANFLDFIELGRLGTPPELPPILAEQQRIVARIEALNAQIQEAHELRQQAGEETEALLGAQLGAEFAKLAKRLPVKPLGDLSSHIVDGPHVTPVYLLDGVAGIPFVTVKNMVSGKLDFRDINYISEDDHNVFSKRCGAKYGDVLYSKDGATRGRPCFVDTDQDFSFFVSVALIKPLRDQLDGRYLVHLLKSNWIKDRMVSKSRGDMIPHIVLREIRDFPVPLPPLSEQRRVVAELDALQTQVEALKKLQAETAAELSALLPSILDKAFKGQL